MRIVGGKYKGRVIKTLKGLRIRPTSEKVREALFDILGERLKNNRVLDLFAGSGALGLEALSRGARKIVFVERERPAVKIIRENAARLGLSPFIEVVNSDYEAALKKLGKKGRVFDVVMADPPYHLLAPGEKKVSEKLLFMLGEYGTLSPKGIFVLEHFAKVQIPEQFNEWQRIRKARYGQTCLSFFVKNKIFSAEKF